MTQTWDNQKFSKRKIKKVLDTFNDIINKAYYISFGIRGLRHTPLASDSIPSYISLKGFSRTSIDLSLGYRTSLKTGSYDLHTVSIPFALLTKSREEIDAYFNEIERKKTADEEKRRDQKKAEAKESQMEEDAKRFVELQRRYAKDSEFAQAVNRKKSI